MITDGNGNLGFPGFTPITASQSLGYVAAMQEHGINVTFAYISDAHDDPATELASGPGQADYIARLAAYNEAWGKFFTRLAADGITKDNTLFVITADEGDHFAGGAPSPASCDGVKVPCTYAKIGEIDTNLTDLLDKQNPALASTPFDVHFDMAPTFYVEGNPAPGAPIARAYEVATSQLTTTSVITGEVDQLTRYLADPVELKLLHMVTGDPRRTPTFVMFGNPDYYFQTDGTPDFVENPGFAWNHGGVDPRINRTWLGMVGPGVARRGIDEQTWSDHTDIRPTMLVLAGLTDDYAHDGRVLVENLRDGALPRGLRGESAVVFRQLAAAYKQINAPVGELGMDTLKAFNHRSRRRRRDVRDDRGAARRAHDQARRARGDDHSEARGRRVPRGGARSCVVPLSDRSGERSARAGAPPVALIVSMEGARRLTATALLAVFACHGEEVDCKIGLSPIDGRAPRAVAVSSASLEASLEKRRLSNLVAYIPPQCFTKTRPAGSEAAKNPCYVCHADSPPPNFNSDGKLQLSLLLPVAAIENPWTNLFEPPVATAPRTSDEEVLRYVRQSNYFDGDGALALSKALDSPLDEWDIDGNRKWDGYRPDVSFQFDDHGFDHGPGGAPTGWRAFAYYPFPGTFFPTNGSADDVLIRLDPRAPGRS